MKEYDVNLLIREKSALNKKIEEFIRNNVIIIQKIDLNEIKGHIEKAENNLNFVKDNLKLGYHDWCITGCYYASYHVVLALIMTNGYVSKNHLATLCLLIKEFYKKGLEKEDLMMMNDLFIDYQDLIFYVESKNRREDATYSTKRIYDRAMVGLLRSKTALFVNKVKDIIKNISV